MGGRGFGEGVDFFEGRKPERMGGKCFFIYLNI